VASTASLANPLASGPVACRVVLPLGALAEFSARLEVWSRASRQL